MPLSRPYTHKDWRSVVVIMEHKDRIGRRTLYFLMVQSVSIGLDIARGLMQTKEEIFEQIQLAFVDLFEIEKGRVTLEARLNEDLEIDSIDAVDLLDRLRRRTGCKIAAEDFRTVRTVGDMVDAVHKIVRA